jgi:hypothetical protein
LPLGQALRPPTYIWVVNKVPVNPLVVNEVPANLPGHELVRAGLVDLTAGRETEASLVVTMAAPRLRALGFDVPAGGGEHPAYRLYEMLCRRDGGAHSRYNALVGRMVSFARAAEHAASG